MALLGLPVWPHFVLISLPKGEAVEIYRMPLILLLITAGN